MLKLSIIYLIPIILLWIASIVWVISDAKRRKLPWLFWGIATFFLWLIPYGLFHLSRVSSGFFNRFSLPVGLQLVDRYLYREIFKMTVVTVLGIAFIILANNLYTTADLFAQKKIEAKEATGQTDKTTEKVIDLKILAKINLLDTPAMVVLAFPVASLIGVMLALGILGSGGEITAIRTGGISLPRLLLPIILISFVFSAFTYVLSQKVVPWCGERSTQLKEEYLTDKEANVERHPIFKNKDMVIYAQRYNTKEKTLGKITVIQEDENGLFRFWLGYTGLFKPDKLIIHQVKEYICDSDAKLLRYRDKIPRVVFPFPTELQTIHEKKRDAFSYAAGDLATKIQRLEESGIDPLAAKIDQQFQISVPLACTIFSFVGFFFSIYNPRKEASAGILYAILIAFIYYVFMAIIRSLAKQDQEILRNPYFAAWLTNVVFFIFGVVLFTKVRR